MKKFFLLIALLGLIAQGTWADTRDGSTTSQPSWNGSAAVISSAAESSMTAEDELMWRLPFDGVYYEMYSGGWAQATHKDTQADLGDNYDGLTVANIPASLNKGGYIFTVTKIGDKTFAWCRTLKSVTIANSVKSIGQEAFYQCTGLTTATLSNGLEVIGNRAFCDCSALTSIKIPNTVTRIGARAFETCVHLDSLEIPGSVTNIEDESFLRCARVKSVTLGYGVTTIGNSSFAECEAMDSLSIPNSVTSIGQQAFFRCKGLTSVTIPNSVTNIGSKAFWRCTGLTSVTIPNSVTSIGVAAFEECSGLTSVAIPNSVTSIGEGIFANCTGLATIKVDAGNTVYDSRDNCNAIIKTSENRLIQGCKNTIIPNSVTSIGNSAFSRCTGLTSLPIPNSVTSIGQDAFAYCENLESIVIPDSVANIGAGAFWFCTGLKSVRIGSRVTEIGWGAFVGCSGLTYITCKALTPPALVEPDLMFLKIDKTIPLYVPSGSIAAYQAAEGWKDFNIQPLPDWNDPNLGTASNPFVIYTTDMWDDFAEQVNNGNRFNGKYVKLGADISVKTMAGMYEQAPFCGTFLGDGHTVTATLSDDENDGSALFRYINGATIKNLKVAGTIGGRRYSAALVGISKGNGNRIENCVVSADVKGFLNVGGILGRSIESEITICGCVFIGKLSGNTSNVPKGAFIGWFEDNNRKVVTDCLFIMQSDQETENLDLVRGHGEITLSKCFKTRGNAAPTGAPMKIPAEDIPPTDEEDDAEEEYYGIWANVYDVMPDYFGNLLEDYGFLKVYEGGLEYEGLYYVACISMEDHLDNSALIDLATDYIVDVSLSDQLFRKDNQWYTLCLPFDLDNFTGTPLEGATVKTLSSSSYDAGTNTLTMDFSDNLTAIEAGKPYIVKWTEGEDIIFPMFAGVTVSTDAADVQTTYADFIGTYNYIDYAEEDRSILLLIGDALEYPEEGAHNIACSAYFRLKEGLVAGEPMRIVLNFNESTQVVNLSADEQQIIKFIKDGKLYIHRGSKIYTATGAVVK